MYRATTSAVRPNLCNMPRGRDGTMAATRQLCGRLRALGDLGDGGAAATYAFNRPMVVASTL